MKRIYFICLFLCLATLSICPAQAQTETVLYNFTGGSDGNNPSSSLTSDGAGNFYGTTITGGTFGLGTVFEVSPNGNGGWNETVLHSFTGGADGANPCYSYVLFDNTGNLYGTTESGGDLTCNAPYGCGVVFELSPVAATWAENVLYSFTSLADSAFPVNGLIRDASGNLYGTTLNISSTGGVFQLSLSGGNWTEQVIYTNDNDSGYMPTAGLAMDSDGNIFGVTPSTVFEVSPNGHGGWNPTIIHTFTGAPTDGSYAEGTPVLDQNGNLYGTTQRGGVKGMGTVYKLSPGKNGWTNAILHSFTGGKAGSEPYAGIVFDAAGNIYGTTYGGGKPVTGKGNLGTVFELAAPVRKNGKYKEKSLWSFDGLDGYYPNGLVLDAAGNVYGTTAEGGPAHVHGVVFEVTP